ncbi:hypothetical protein K492DRAFT_184390 [Lichtheimia hyalospora FSU 10163]|nr:hypothetical protein K492DRAFT_184390 [Lichtheimia hyalospora FSU 10163]
MTHSIPNHPFQQRTHSNVAHDAHGSSLSTSRQLPVQTVATTRIPVLVDSINYLDASTLCSYLYVSKLWRGHVIQCLGGLRFSIFWEQDRQEQRCSELVQFAQHTVALSIDHYEEWISDLLLDNDLCSLEKITINEDYPSIKNLVLLIYEEGVGFIYSNQGQPCDEQGITDTTIESDYEYSITSQDLPSLLKQHQRTLVRLE